MLYGMLEHYFNRYAATGWRADALGAEKKCYEYFLFGTYSWSGRGGIWLVQVDQDTINSLSTPYVSLFLTKVYGSIEVELQVFVKKS